MAGREGPDSSRTPHRGPAPPLATIKHRSVRYIWLSVCCGCLADPDEVLEAAADEEILGSDQVRLALLLLVEHVEECSQFSVGKPDNIVSTVRVKVEKI